MTFVNCGFDCPSSFMLLLALADISLSVDYDQADPGQPMSADSYVGMAFRV